MVAGAVEKLLEMRSKNLIRDVSLGMNDPNAILSVINHYPRGSIDSVMVAGAWNLLDQVRARLLACPRASARSNTHQRQRRSISLSLSLTRRADAWGWVAWRQAGRGGAAGGLSRARDQGAQRWHLRQRATGGR